MGRERERERGGETECARERERGWMDIFALRKIGSGVIEERKKNKMGEISCSQRSGKDVF